MNIRQKRILTFILKKERLELKEIANKLNVSERSIRNDIRELNDVLFSNGLLEIEVKSDKTFFLDKETANKALDIINGLDFYDYKLSQEERVFLIVEMLINSKKYLNLADISEKLFVSQSTISSDLKNLQKIISQYDLEYISEAYTGIKLIGDEYSKRCLLLDLICTNKDFYSFSDYRFLRNDLMDTGVDKFNQIMSIYESNNNLFMTDDSYSRISTYLYIIIQRIREGYTLRKLEANTADLYNSNAKKITEIIEQNYNITLNEYELRAIALQLSGQNYITKESTSNNIIKIQFYIRKLVDNLYHLLGTDLSKDYMFFTRLCLHVDYMVKSKIYHKINKSVIEQVKNDNEDVRKAVVESAYILEELLNREISEVEIDYILIHVCTAIERMKVKESAIKAVLISDLGIAATQFLHSKISSNFEFSLIDIIPAHGMKNFDYSQIDLVISLVNVDESLLKIPVVKVDYDFGDKDYSNIYNQLNLIRKKKDDVCSVTNFLKDVDNILAKQGVTNRREITTKIVAALKSNNIKSFDQNELFNEQLLSDLLDKRHIRFDVHASTWEESVRIGFENLVEEGYARPGYVDKVIEKIKDDGPYMIIAKGFIVPHAGVLDGGLKTGFSLIKLSKSISYSDKYSPVDYVCCLTVTDIKAHLKAFFTLVNFVQNEFYVNQLNSCTSADEVHNLIIKYEGEKPNERVKK